MRFVIKLILLLLVVLGISVFVAVQPLFYNHQANIAVRVMPTALEGHVKMLSQTNPPRADSTANLDISAAYIARQFERAKGKFGSVNEYEFQVAGKTYRNVSLLMGEGNRPRIVIGAHYDSYEGFPGADDNASGVAVLLEVAKLLTSRDNKNDIEFIAYSLEEPPFFASEQMGSYFHVKRLAESNVEIKLMLSLEMLGYYSDEEGSQAYPLPGMSMIYPKKGNYVALISDLRSMLQVRRAKMHMQSALDFPAYSFTSPSFVKGVAWSDQLWFWANNYPAIMVTDTAFFRNLSYHTEQDTMDRLDFVKMAKVADGVHQIILAFDE